MNIFWTKKYCLFIDFDELMAINVKKINNKTKTIIKAKQFMCEIVLNL